MVLRSQQPSYQLLTPQEPVTKSSAVAMLPGKLICNTCDVSFTTIEEQREHARCEYHVRRLRLRVAAADMAPPSIQESYRGELCELSDLADEDSPQPDSEDEGPPGNKKMADFYPGNCLFCPQISASLDQNLAHMKTCHGFSIPYQSQLAVETEALIWYLHLVIFGFHECISCGKQRNTLEGVQQHMLKKGHCRFDMTDDMMEFYNSEEIKGHSKDDCVRTDEETLRLPSGKPLSNRSQGPKYYNSALEPACQRAAKLGSFARQYAT
ncbi:hypothetical protein FSARC_12206 [Fusarium sarcochroum]|uniref:C2H2-type domain-containing protein n=1 Tax=Fusarium sarcochroum TaxID=1208366 RepID=A0A8H4TAC5_9HYPO|nr:hypothetical protein FSARC_12206 [Fusarium sarcochroum]